jgi:DNA-binding CsgD family transcriptional regulator
MPSGKTMRAVHSPKPSSIRPKGLPVGYFLTALDNFKIGIAILDRRLRYEAISHALAEMHDLPPVAHLGKTLREVIGPLAVPVASNYHHVFSTGEPLANVRHSGRLPNRPRVFHWIANYFPLRDKRGRVDRVCAFVMKVKLRPQLQGSLDAPLSPAIGEGTHGRGRAFRSAEMLHGEGSKTRRKAVVLSPREQQVLRFLAQGNSNKEISTILGISVKTVETHRSRIMLKIDASSLVQLVHYAIRHKMVEPQG